MKTKKREQLGKAGGLWWVKEVEGEGLENSRVVVMRGDQEMMWPVLGSNREFLEELCRKNNEKKLGKRKEGK